MQTAKFQRFLFTVAGGYGHFHPLVPLALALKKAGHEVAFAMSPSLQPLAEAAGFTVFPISSQTDIDPEYIEFKRQLEAMPVDLSSELFLYPRLFIGISTRLRTPYLMEIAQTWQPNLIIREAGEYAAIIVAECLGLPHATVAFAAALQTMSIFEQEAARYLDPIRQQWGLATDPALKVLYPYLHLAYSPPTFSLADVSDQILSIPVTTHFIRPDFFDNANQESLPTWIDDLPNQPTVYVTLGTEVNSIPELYPSVLQTIIAGLRDMPINLIVTLGRGKDPTDFGTQPTNVHIEPYLPQSLLLPKCDLIVMHGGSGSLLASLAIGLPMVIIPLIADQFFNAYASKNLQLGQVVERDQLTPESIRAAVNEVLNNSVYQEKSKELQAEMAKLPSQDYAVKLIERATNEHKPFIGYT